MFVYFRYPLKNEENNKQWINAIRREGFIPTKNSFIRSDHFLRPKYNIKPDGSYRVYLKDTAVPSIISDPCTKKEVTVMSIVDIGNEPSAEELDERLVKDIASELVNNNQDLSNSEYQERVIEVLEELPDSPTRESTLKEDT